VNLTGTSLLGVERSRLVNQPLSRFVAPASRVLFLAFLHQVLAEPGKWANEALLQKSNGTTFWASLHGLSALTNDGRGKWCRLAVSDITALKEAEQTQRRVEIMAATNAELRQEIAHRQVAEAELKNSEQHKSRLLELAHGMQAQLRHLTHQLLRAQEEERKRISRELHDEITQTLVAISVHLAVLTRGPTITPQLLKEEIAQTHALVEVAVKMVHNFARALRPDHLDDLGLVASLRSLLEGVREQTGLHIRLTAFTTGWVQELDDDTRTVCYRVAQEALANVVRHAHATRAEVRLQKLPQAFRLTIKDNGKSFSVKRALDARTNRRLGLIGMRERVEMIGGTFTIESAPGHGTTIRAEIPFPSGNAGGDKTAASSEH